MNKTQFFKRCRTCKRMHQGHAVEMRIVRRPGQHLGSDTCIYLDGVWAGGSILSTELYRPDPGRQGHYDWRRGQSYDYEARDRKLAAAEKKFNRWLAEWQSGHYTTFPTQMPAPRIPPGEATSRANRREPYYGTYPGE